jgi:hypothetical protein
LRQQFVRALEGGVYTFKITDKSYLPTRLFGEFDTAVSRRPLSAELDVKNKDRYKIGDTLSVAVSYCSYDPFDFFGLTESTIIVVPYG